MTSQPPTDLLPPPPPRQHGTWLGEGEDWAETAKDLPSSPDLPGSELLLLVGQPHGAKPTAQRQTRHLNGDPAAAAMHHQQDHRHNLHRRHPEEEPVTLRARTSSERQPLLGDGSESAPGNFGEGEGDWVQVVTGDCPSVIVSGDVRGRAAQGQAGQEQDDVVSRDTLNRPRDEPFPDAPHADVSTTTAEDAVPNDVRTRPRHGARRDVKHRHSDGSFSDVRTSQDDVGGRGDVSNRASASARGPPPGGAARSFTADCLGRLGEGEGDRQDSGDHGATTDRHRHHGDRRRLSSGDDPYWLHSAQDGTSDLRNMTLVVPAPSTAEESYLIGRASPRSDAMRMTRLTEVAPTNSSIVDDEDQWKMPLQVFTSKRQGIDIGQYKSKRIRSYYKAQDLLITAYEDISLRVNDDLVNTDVIKRQRKLAAMFSKITLAINVALLVGKLVASILSGSISIISSLVDSVVDLLSGIIMWWATRAVKKRDPYTYPQGRTKLEPVAIIILSVVMALASLQLIRESVEKMVTLAADPSDLPRMEAPTFAIAGSTVVVKLVLWLVCRRVRSSIVQALAMDHRNDVLSNTVAIVCGYLGSREFQDQVGVQGFMYVDPGGAIIISLYIVINWWQTGSEQIEMLTGHTARPDFLSKLTWTAMNHDRNIRHIDTVRAFHFGNNFLVELDIVLPEDMSLRVAHDIGESLQQKLENIPEVERAFVHLDYEYSHNPNSEHKVV